VLMRSMPQEGPRRSSGKGSHLPPPITKWSDGKPKPVIDDYVPVDEYMPLPGHDSTRLPEPPVQQGSDHVERLDAPQSQAGIPNQPQLAVSDGTLQQVGEEKTT
jgi:hypothetical protein